MLELAQPTRKLVETNYCVVMNRPIAGDLTIHLYFVVLIKADHIRGTSPQQTTSTFGPITNGQVPKPRINCLKPINLYLGVFDKKLFKPVTVKLS